MEFGRSGVEGIEGGKLQPHPWSDSEQSCVQYKKNIPVYVYQYFIMMQTSMSTLSRSGTSLIW